MTTPAVETTVAFQAKHPFNTYWIAIEHAAGAPPQALIRDLLADGWQIESYPVPPLNGKEETRLTKPGSAIFQLWQPAERRLFAETARRILRRHRFVNVPLHRLTMAEMI